MSTNGEYRRIGRVSKPHGIRGAFTVFLESDFPDWLVRQKHIFAEVNGVVVQWNITNCRQHQKALIMAVAEVVDRNRAEELRQTPLLITEEDARSMAHDPDYFYNSDLVGLEVFHKGVSIGKINDVIEMPMQSLLEVTSADNHVFHIPFVADLVEEVDLASGKVDVNIPEGLIEINQKNPA